MPPALETVSSIHNSEDEEGEESIGSASESLGSFAGPRVVSNDRKYDVVLIGVEKKETAEEELPSILGV